MVDSLNQGGVIAWDTKVDQSYYAKGRQHRKDQISNRLLGPALSAVTHR